MTLRSQQHLRQPMIKTRNCLSDIFSSSDFFIRDNTPTVSRVVTEFNRKLSLSMFDNQKRQKFFQYLAGSLRSKPPSVNSAAFFCPFFSEVYTSPKKPLKNLERGNINLRNGQMKIIVPSFRIFHDANTSLTVKKSCRPTYPLISGAISRKWKFWQRSVQRRIAIFPCKRPVSTPTQDVHCTKAIRYGRTSVFFTALFHWTQQMFTQRLQGFFQPPLSIMSLAQTASNRWQSILFRTHDNLITHSYIYNTALRYRQDGSAKWLI